MRVHKHNNPPPTDQTRVYLDKYVWKEVQPNGDEKWFAVHPKTGETVEIDPDQAYFWTEEWQKGEHEADEDIAAGRVKTFDTMEALLADLDTDDE